MAIRKHQKVIAFVAATAIAITSFGASAAQARDHNRDAAIAALLGLAVVGAIIANDRKKDHVTRQHVTRQKAHIAPRPLPKRARLAPLPRHCLTRVETRRGDLGLFGRRCLQRNYVGWNSLPQKCVRRVETHRGARTAYAAPCLRRSGYQIAHR